MENTSLTEICRLLASCCAVVISTLIMGRIRASCQTRGRWREAYDLVNERAPSGLCMCPFYYACQWACAFRLVHVSLLLWSGWTGAHVWVALAWIPFMTCLWPICGKERILYNLPDKCSGAETKMCVGKYSTSSKLVLQS